MRRIGYFIGVVGFAFVLTTSYVLKTTFASEASESKGNPYHEKCDMCGESHGGLRCKPREATDYCEHKHHTHHEDNVCDLMSLARSAKEELLKEKMKANLEAKIGKKLDKVADLFVNDMIDKCKKIEESEKKYKEFEEKLQEIFKEEDSRIIKPTK